ncbi:uncharacterized protein LOC134845701 [Symsagittifera roscoffensis]|uniref:uncharacterized protein LOC134845701 n=1 Tax=Symsagittifera roscoffensis TaxID=84072 RepID=UPI00307B1453
MPVFRVTDFLTNGETQSIRKIQVSGSASLMQAELSVSTPQKSNGVVHISSRESERRGELTGSQDIEDKEEETPKNDSSVVIMLLVVCCSYLVLTAFAAFFNVLGHHYISEKPAESTASTSSVEDGDRESVLLFVQSMAEIPAVMNNSLNFVFYMLSGRTFRNTFIHKISSLAR